MPPWQKERGHCHRHEHRVSRRRGLRDGGRGQTIALPSGRRQDRQARQAVSPAHCSKYLCYWSKHFYRCLPTSTLCALAAYRARYFASSWATLASVCSRFRAAGLAARASCYQQHFCRYMRRNQAASASALRFVCSAFSWSLGLWLLETQQGGAC